MEIHNNAFLRYNIPHIYIKTQCYNLKQFAIHNSITYVG